MLIYCRPKFILIFFLGVVSGLPLPLTAATLSLFLTDLGLDLKQIGILSIAGTPYAFKYIWSPLVDNIRIPILGRKIGHRKSWLLLIQCLLIISILLMGQVNSNTPFAYIGGMTLLIAFLSATQDIIVAAFRIEILNEEEQAAGVAVAVFSYRIGMLISGAGALYVSSVWGWKITYLVMALSVIPSVFAVLIAKEPAHHAIIYANLKVWFNGAFIQPFADFIRRRGWLMMLLLIVFYRLPDAYISLMTSPFLVDIGFSKAEIASIVKTFGMAAMLAGTGVAGILVSKLGIFKGLVLGMVLQGLSNAFFMWQALKGYDLSLLLFVNSIENFCSGISSTTFVAYVSSLTTRKFAATQYAFFSSLAEVGRSIISVSSGYVAAYLGWANFFAFSVFLALPSLFCLYYMYRKDIRY